MTYLLSAIFGLISGAIASLIAPWVYWGIEKKRKRRTARNELVLNARKYIESQYFSGLRFHKEACFVQLKPYLKKSIIEHIMNFEEYYEFVDDPGELDSNLRVELLDQLQRIEKKWGLI